MTDSYSLHTRRIRYNHFKHTCSLGIGISFRPFPLFTPPFVPTRFRYHSDFSETYNIDLTSPDTKTITST